MDPRRSSLVITVIGVIAAVVGTVLVLSRLIDQSWIGALRLIWVPLLGGALVAYGYQRRDHQGPG